MNYPCKNCKDDRYPGCHDHCPEYLEVKAKHDAYKAEQRKYKDAADHIVDMVNKNRDHDNKAIRSNRHHVR